MGVSGSGKSTVGKLLSDRLNCPFYDADDFHPSSNIEKMSLGTPLNDSDRNPWLLTLQNIVDKTTKEEKSAVMACSALKKRYRNLITGENPQKVIWIYLRGDYHTISDRIKKRQNHFFSADLLPNQFNTLEEPKSALIVDVTLDPQIIVERIVDFLQE